eukprot:TRINITY_DN10320_c0_g2_i3.p1 TRINITY_DN10320_c0_g2~~TRINITY_DN10320_c0_g2_i3.p1  ORF type:complete len:235 (-),score=50.06 TRINITY_DN10320_c0_g2_i3:87-791(-)
MGRDGKDPTKPNVKTVVFGPPPPPGKLREFPGLPASRYDPSKAMEVYCGDTLRKEKEGRAHCQKFGRRYQQPVGGGRDLLSLRGDMLPGLENINRVYTRIGWEKEPRLRRWIQGASMDITAEDASSVVSSRSRRSQAPSLVASEQASSAPRLPTAAELDGVGETWGSIGMLGSQPGRQGSQQLGRSMSDTFGTTSGSMTNFEREFRETVRVRKENLSGVNMTKDLFCHPRLALM